MRYPRVVLTSLFALLSVGGACRKQPSPAPEPPKPWAPPELSGAEPVLIPPNAGRFLLHPLKATHTDKPDVPKATAVVKLCVSRTGEIERTDFVEPFSAAVDEPLAAFLKTWKHKPYLVGGQPKAFCYAMRFSYEKGRTPAWVF